MTRLKDLSGWQRALALAVLALILYVGYRAIPGNPYTLTLVMPSADQSFVGGQVLIHGNPVGKVTSIGVKDNQALVKVEIDSKYAPLPAGTTATITWQSVLGARVVSLTPGKATNPSMPSGYTVTGNTEAVDVDDLLATLDAPTRAHLQTMIGQLNSLLSGAKNQQNLNTTLKEAGPTFQAIGQLVQSVGEDGPAIKQLITQLHGVTSTVANRDSNLVNTINQLNELTTTMAARQQQLSQTIAELPSTISNATSALNNVAGPVSSTRTLLRTLEPATAQLPTIAKLANPVLTDAQPALALLPSTLKSADQLLQRTPSLVSDVNATLPSVTSALNTANPMVAFLRPYTPELVGWLSNWDGVFGSMDGSGHIARALITSSASSLDELPSVPVGMGQTGQPKPGSLVAWTDAAGSGIH